MTAKWVLFVAGLAAAADFQPIPYKTCKSVFAVRSVEAIGCPQDGAQRCVFKQNTEPQMRIGFVPDRDVPALQAKVRARLDGSYVNFHLENSDACAGQNLTCPLRAGQTYYYTQAVKIVREYPAVNVLVNWILNDPATFADPAYHEGEQRIKNDLCIIFKAKVEAN